MQLGKFMFDDYNLSILSPETGMLEVWRLGTLLASSDWKHKTTDKEDPTCRIIPKMMAG